jgi:hypothetical protein
MAFFGAEAYLPLTPTRVHNGGPEEVGIPSTLSAPGWSFASWVSGRPRVAAWQRGRRLAVGFALLAGAWAPCWCFRLPASRSGRLLPSGLTQASGWD